VKSKTDKGTTFNLFFPVQANTMQTVPQTQDVIFQGKGTILVIDDEDIIRNLLETILTKLGYNVLLAKDGLDGIQLYKEHSNKIDLVLLDMIMPRMNGKDCFYKLKTLNENAKVIIVSGYTDEANIEKLKDDGLIDYIKKPFKKSELSQKLSSALSESEDHVIELTM
jgi:DNA-binding NtrC family response regulator